MASHLLVLLLSSAVACSTAAATAPSSRSLVQSACNDTGDYDLCVATLVADPSSSTADLPGLTAIVISAAAANASASQVALANTTSGHGRWMYRKCADMYGDARDSLEVAREAVRQPWSVGDAYFKVNDATEYTDGCRDLFLRRLGSYPTELASREGSLLSLCGIAISIIMKIT